MRMIDKAQSLPFINICFALSGGSTKEMPIIQPQIFSLNIQRGIAAIMIFRDAERADNISAASTKNIAKRKWRGSLGAHL